MKNMNYLYSTYVSSFYYRNVDSEISDSYHHEDNILIAAESQEEAKAKVEAWVASKHRKLDRMDEPFDMPRKWFIGGWKQKQKGRKWYEVNACGIKENGKLQFFYGYIFAPNKKFVKDKLKEMGYPCFLYISKEDWNVYIK